MATHPFETEHRSYSGKTPPTFGCSSRFFCVLHRNVMVTLSPLLFRRLWPTSISYNRIAIVFSLLMLWYVLQRTKRLHAIFVYFPHILLTHPVPPCVYIHFTFSHYVSSSSTLNTSRSSLYIYIYFTFSHYVSSSSLLLCHRGTSVHLRPPLDYYCTGMVLVWYVLFLLPGGLRFQRGVSDLLLL